MKGKGELLRAVDDLEAALRQSAGLLEGLDDHRMQGIAFRRQIADKVALIGSLGGQAFDENGQAGFRGEFSKLRSAMAYHQARWPIVSIDPENPQYVESVQSLREANRNFISWVRSARATS